jgi:hypothetical protein
MRLTRKGKGPVRREAAVFFVVAVLHSLPSRAARQDGSSPARWVVVMSSSSWRLGGHPSSVASRKRQMVASIACPAPT